MNPQAGAPRGNAREGVLAAVDLGATSGRVVLGYVGNGRVDIEVVHRFANEPVRVGDGLHWNILELYRHVLHGLRIAARREPNFLSIGIDSWAIDYGLLNGERLIGTPFHYRDERSSRGVRMVDAMVEHHELFSQNGLQFLPFTTLYQLVVDHAEGELGPRTHMLLIPDLIGAWLTGRHRAERTNASTTGLLDVRSGTWNENLRQRLGLPAGLMPALVDPGDVVGPLLDQVRAQLGIRAPVPVTAVGSHDTASAVVAVPMDRPGAAYICSGTWSLVGVELAHPILTEEAQAANFTNEAGVDGRVRFLRNRMGMWLLNECFRRWQEQGEAADLPQVVAAAGHVGRWAFFDVDHPDLVAPGDMPRRVQRHLAVAGLHDPTPAEVVRSIIESLANTYADTVNEIEQLTGTPVHTVHIVGGASQNSLLCQLIADRSGRPVIAGPVEATAIGNILVQARAHGLLDGDLEQLREVVRRSYPPTTFQARQVAATVTEQSTL